MAIFNVMETIVTNVFTEFQKSYQLACSCEECKNDILALTLNKIPPKYAATAVGEILVKVAYSDTNLKQQIVKELALSAMTVEKSPRHEGEKIREKG